MKRTSRLLWVSINDNGSIALMYGVPALYTTKREAELKSPIGKAVKVLVNITPT